jgi:quinol monooxygenase YgiN
LLRVTLTKIGDITELNLERGVAGKAASAWAECQRRKRAGRAGYRWREMSRHHSYSLAIWNDEEHPMIVEYTRYKIDEARRNNFEDAYKKAGESLEASSHCLRYELSHCVEDPDHYALRIEWDSEEGHLKGFRSSPEFKAFFPLVQPYVKDIEEMRHYEVISTGGKAR